jgi:signal transduction histidine kinase
VSAGEAIYTSQPVVHAGRRQLYQPTWWRLIAWTGIAVVTAFSIHTPRRQILVGALMAVTVVAMLFSAHPRLARPAVIVTTAAGLAAMFASPAGLAEIPVLMASSRIPGAFSARGTWIFGAVDTVVFGASVGWISNSAPGLLAGFGVPLLIQRAAEHQELIVQRDRAQALLAEVQAGRDAAEQAAALSERGRIARDMHDVLAHSLAGLSLQLQATRAIAAREGVGDAVLGPLDKAAALARDGLTEAREAVSTLRDPVGLGMDALPALVERHPGDVELSTTGTPATVSPEAEHAIYRVVQESLTNAARYAPGSPVQVELSWQEKLLRVRVDDVGLSPGRVAVAHQGTGLGLSGMQERLLHVDGSVRAGPRAGGGWRVEATVTTS